MSKDGSYGPSGPKNRKPWTYDELATVWRHPDMTATEVAGMLPGRTAKAVSRIRARFGRYRDSGVTPICQKCGLHPVWVAAADGKRWGLCRECTLGERAYLVRNGKRLSDIDNAQRQARFKKSRKDS